MNASMKAVSLAICIAVSGAPAGAANPIGIPKPPGGSTDVSVTLGAGLQEAIALASPCRLDRPVILLRVTVVNDGVTSTPARSDGLHAADQTFPDWTATAALPPLAPHASAPVTIAVAAPRNFQELAGEHRFFVTAADSSSPHGVAGPARITIPAGYCTTAANVISNNLSPNLPVGSRPGPQSGPATPPRNVTVPENIPGKILDAPPSIPAPSGLASTADLNICVAHKGGDLCALLMASGELPLIWNWSCGGARSICDIDGYHVYEVAPQKKLLGTMPHVETTIQGETFQVGTCYEVKAYKGSLESKHSNEFCVGRNVSTGPQTLTINPALITTSGFDSINDNSALCRGGPPFISSAIGQPGLGEAIVGDSRTFTTSTLGCDIRLVQFARAGVVFDMTPLLGKTIVKASLQYRIDSAQFSANGEPLQSIPMSCAALLKRSTVDFQHGWDVNAPLPVSAGGKPLPGYRQQGSNFAIDVSNDVQSWANGHQNFGFALTGTSDDETRHDQNGACLTTYGGFSLIVQFV
ncbi:MAG: hypothetical protein NVS2B17_16910 [Candidatus Velthaea sp.]